MEGNSRRRGGWWLFVLATVFVVVLALTASWRWAVAKEGIINGERATIFIDRTVSQMKPGSRILNPETVLQANAEAVLTLLRAADGRPTLMENWTERLRWILPHRLSVRILPPRPTSRDTAASFILMQLVNQSRVSGTNQFLEALAILPEEEALSLGVVVLGLARQSQADAPLMEAVLRRLLTSSQSSANDFAVILQMQPALELISPSPSWFGHAERLVRSRTNFQGLFWEIPGYLRRKRVPKDVAEPILKTLSQDLDPFARVEAKIELWRRNQESESREMFVRRIAKEEGIGGFDKIVDLLRLDLRFGDKASLPVVKECISQLVGFQSKHAAYMVYNGLPQARMMPNPSSSRLSMFFGSPFRNPYYDPSTIGSRVVALTAGLETELQPQAAMLLDVLKSRTFSRNDRLAVAGLLQQLPDEPAEVVDALIKGFEDKSLGLDALPYLGKYGPKVADKLAGAMELLNSSDFTERRAAAGFFKRATPANPALLDRWIAGLRDSGIQAIAAEALGDYGPSASKAAPALAELVASDSRAAGLRELRLTSIASLRKIRPEYSVISSALMAALNDKPGARLHAEIVSAAKTAILDLAPANHADRDTATRTP